MFGCAARENNKMDPKSLIDRELTVHREEAVSVALGFVVIINTVQPRRLE